ncbi:MAG: hypothetical protein PF542_00205 [Nanoarchaeota archaeon]|jgi:hypothetical protein|nr:hypothetical protein [Nanoarchaeota archaeon]
MNKKLKTIDKIFKDNKSFVAEGETNVDPQVLSPFSPEYPGNFEIKSEYDIHPKNKDMNISELNKLFENTCEQLWKNGFTENIVRDYFKYSYETGMEDAYCSFSRKIGEIELALNTAGITSYIDIPLKQKSSKSKPKKYDIIEDLQLKMLHW